MRLLHLIRVTLAMLVFASPALAEKIPLSAISDYFNQMKTAEAEFTQVSDDGSISTGNILIRRPGRIRFEYNPPDANLVMAGKGQVAIFDAKSNQPPERFSLVSTPLYLILAKNVDFERANMVVAHTFDGTTTTITAQDPDNPDYGNIQLVFTDNPVALRQWIVNDGSGLRTTVILGEFSFGRSMRASLFDIGDEMQARGF